MDTKTQKKIINLTQHEASEEQTNAGVYEPAIHAEEIKSLLTFKNLPLGREIELRAKRLAVNALTEGAQKAMIGGAPYLMSALEKALKNRGITPLYSFSQRESVEEKQADGSVRKVAVFRHLGFVEVV